MNIMRLELDLLVRRGALVRTGRLHLVSQTAVALYAAQTKCARRVHGGFIGLSMTRYTAHAVSVRLFFRFTLTGVGSLVSIDGKRDTLLRLQRQPARADTDE